MSLYGKPSDAYGPKPVFLSALAIFLGGSCPYGISQNMIELIALRAVQGIGTGGLMAIALTIIGTLSRMDENSEEALSESASKSAYGDVLFGVGRASGRLWAVWSRTVSAGAGSSTSTCRWVSRSSPSCSSCPSTASAARLTSWARRCSVAPRPRCRSASGVTRPMRGLGHHHRLLVSSVVLGGRFVRRKLTADELLVSMKLIRNPAFQVMMPISFTAGLGLAGGLFYIGSYLQVGRGLSARADRPADAVPGLWPVRIGPGVALEPQAGRQVQVPAGRGGLSGLVVADRRPRREANL